MKTMVAVMLALTILVAAEPGRGAQTTAGPEDVAREMIALTRQADWKGYVALLHPDALAEFKRLFREIVAAEPSGEAGTLFFGTATLEAYDALGAEVLFERFMTNISAKIPQLAEALQSSDGAVIGSVAEGPDVAHVVYRASASAGGLAVSRVSAFTLRRHEGKWRVLLSGSIEGIAERLGQISGRTAE